MTKLQAVIDLAADLKATVARIEASTPTTQNHYGKYLHLITVASHGDARVGRIMAEALIAAGADWRGVGSAFKIAFGGH